MPKKKTPREVTHVWIFVGGSVFPVGFPSGVFYDLEEAKAWIDKHKLCGTLTKYPIGVGAYDWAISKGYFIPKKQEHTSPSFIGRFSSASMEHYHFEEEDKK